MRLLLFFVLIASSVSAYGTDYYWVPSYGPSGPFASADAACRSAYAKWVASDTQANPGRIPLPYKAPYPVPNTETYLICDLMDLPSASATMPAGGQATISRGGTGCASGQSYNPLLGACESPLSPIPRKQLGVPRDPLSGQSTCEGNSINSANGNKFQEELDFGDSDGELKFSRYYNGYTGQWRHSYSTSLLIGSTTLVLSFDDGRSSVFGLSAGVATAESTELGSLSKVSSQWVYSSPENEQFSFDSQGRLVQWTRANGLIQSLNYTALPNGNGQVKVTDSLTRSLVFVETSDHHLVSLAAGRMTASYLYNGFNELVKVSYAWPSRTAQRSYVYEDSRNQSWLTGVVDKRGTRYATWHYDDSGRAISSEHANGAEKVTLTYNDDGSTTVLNSLGHTVTYNYQVIQGIRHVASVAGQPAAGCPPSNSTYTFTNIGQVATKTDGLGHVTAYTYDAQGRETQRVEAQGTPQARTISTSWHGSTFLPETVTSDGRTTTYLYDTKNRLLSTSIRSN